MTVDEWLRRITRFLGRELTAAETRLAKTYYAHDARLQHGTAKFAEPPKNQASGTFLIDITDQDDTDVPENKGN